MANDRRTRPTEDDTGKDVIDSTGETIGIVSSVEGETLHVETDPGLTDSIKATLGWGDTEDTQPIDGTDVAEITGEAVHLAAADPEAADIAGADATSTDPDTGPTTEGAETDVETDPTTERDDAVSGDLSDDETAAEMDDTGDPSAERTPGETSATETTDEGVSERRDDPPAEATGAMDGRDANERPPGVEDTSGREDVQDSQTSDPRGTEDVQDPASEEPRDSEDVRDTSEGLNPESAADPDEQPSTSEAATRGAEEDATLGRNDDENGEGRDDRSN